MLIGKTIFKRSGLFLVLGLFLGNTGILQAEGAGISASSGSRQSLISYWDEVGKLYLQSYLPALPVQADKPVKISEQEAFGNLWVHIKPSQDKVLPDQAISQLAVLKDLRILYGTDAHKNNTVANTIDRTRTLSGKGYLVRALADWSTDTTVLKEKQRIASMLLDNPTFVTELEKSLEQIGTIQFDLMSLIFKSGFSANTDPSAANHPITNLYLPTFDPVTTTPSSSFPMRFFAAAVNRFNSVTNKINTADVPYVGSAGLEAWVIWQKLSILRLLGLGLLIGSLGQAWTSSLQDQQLQDVYSGLLNDFGYIDLIADPANGINSLEKLDTKIMADKLSAIGISKELVSHPTLALDILNKQSLVVSERLEKSFLYKSWEATKRAFSVKFNPADKANMTYGGVPLPEYMYNSDLGQTIKLTNLFAIIGINLACGYQAYTDARGYTKNLEGLRKDFSTVVQLEEIRVELQTLLKRYPEFSSMVSEENKGVFQKSFGSESLKNLLEILKSPVFKSEVGITTLGVAKILTANKLFQKVKNEFIAVLKAVGELDYQVSLMRLLKEHRKTPVIYSFAEYSDSTKPYLEFNDVWNPFIPVNEAVPNSITMGVDNGPRDMLLTGSNTGGKSTLLRAMGISVVMAQTIGIVPAGQAIISPFDQLVVLLNVSDDPAAKESTFKAEGMRAKDLVQRIHRMDKDEKTLVFVDELFKGTDSAKGLKWASIISNYIARSEQTICFFATHFHKLKHLETSTNGIFKNYKMDAAKDGGNFICLYKLQEGVCEVNIADDIMRDIFRDIDLGIDTDQELLPSVVS